MGGVVLVVAERVEVRRADRVLHVGRRLGQGPSVDHVQERVEQMREPVTFTVADGRLAEGSGLPIEAGTRVFLADGEYTTGAFEFDPEGAESIVTKLADGVTLGLTDLNAGTSENILRIAQLATLNPACLRAADEAVGFDQLIAGGGTGGSRSLPLGGSAVLTATDALVGQVLRERGYPTGDFDEQAAMVAVDHGDRADAYRRAYAIHRGGDREAVPTDDLREAVGSVPVHALAEWGQRSGGAG